MAVVSFKCPNCDGELIFDPEQQNYKCEYCASKFTQEELDEIQKKQMQASMEALNEAYTEDAESTEAGKLDHAEEDGNQADDTAEQKEQGAVVYSCPSCGAEIVTDATTAATFCYYCHNPVVLSGRLEGKYLPDRVIPFQVSRKEAEKRFLEYVGKKKFVPRAFFNKKQIESLSGVYFPYWVYDAKLAGRLSGEGKKIRIWRTGEEEFTETKLYHIERDGNLEFKNLTQNALQKANVKLAEGVMPYQFDKMEPFKMGYLSGFQAERRDIERESVEQDMQQTMRESAEKMLRESVNGYNAVTVNNIGVTPEKESWYYTLFPVWTVTYRGRDNKVYYYSMNGQTGKVCGELPVDKGRLALTSTIASVIVLILCLIGGYFL